MHETTIRVPLIDPAIQTAVFLALRATILVLAAAGIVYVVCVARKRRQTRR